MYTCQTVVRQTFLFNIREYHTNCVSHVCSILSVTFSNHFYFESFKNCLHVFSIFLEKRVAKEPFAFSWFQGNQSCTCLFIV